MFMRCWLLLQESSTHGYDKLLFYFPQHVAMKCDKMQCLLLIMLAALQVETSHQMPF